MDESHQDPSPYLDAAIYLLAATVAAPEVCESVRDTLGALVAKGKDRLHWHDEVGRSRRLALAEAVADEHLTHIVVVGSPLNPRKPERARRRCLERLMVELCALGVGQIWAESRASADNQRDRAMLGYLRTTRVVPGSLRMDFVTPLAEPMLWAPDIVAGVVGRARARGDSAPLDALQSQITQLDVSV
jgi:hypothetical protein